MPIVVVQQFGNDGSSDEEEDNSSTSKICKMPWTELTEKCGDWIQ